MDFILLCQLCYYSLRTQPQSNQYTHLLHSATVQSPKVTYSGSRLSAHFIGIMVVTSGQFLLLPWRLPTATQSAPTSAGQRTLLSIGLDRSGGLLSCSLLPDDEWINITGTVLGWVSSVFYLGSRVHQIRKIAKRQGVQGLSWGQFLSAVMGNLTYSVSILLRRNDWAAAWQAFPWLLGSLGTLVCDLTILGQFFWYRKASIEESKTIHEILDYYFDDNAPPSPPMGHVRPAPRHGIHGILE